MKKLPIIIGLLFIFNLIIKGLFLNHFPNSLSFQEVEILRFMHINPSINDFSFRLINVFIGGSIDAILFYLIFKKTKNLLLSLIIAIAVGLSPWFVVLSRYLNYYLPLILLTVIVLNILPKKLYPILIAALSLASFRFLVISHDLSSIRLFSIIPDLIRVFDFRTLFFQGDPSSPMLRIPLTGFFYYLDILAFFSGISYLFLINKNKELKTFVNHILLLGLFLFLILPADLLMTQRGELIFLWISIINGLGYYNFFDILRRKSIFFIYIFVFIFSVNFLFTAELFINHFDKKNSSEWSYAEQSTIKYLITKNNEPVYMTNQSDKLYRYWQFLKEKNMKATEVPIDQMKELCKNPQNICIAKKEELSFFDIKKDDAKEKFGNFDGLPIYFILPAR